MEEQWYVSGPSKLIPLLASGYFLREVSCEKFNFIYCNTSALIFKAISSPLFGLIKRRLSECI